MIFLIIESLKGFIDVIKRFTRKEGPAVQSAVTLYLFISVKYLPKPAINVLTILCMMII